MIKLLCYLTRPIFIIIFGILNLVLELPAALLLLLACYLDALFKLLLPDVILYKIFPDVGSELSPSIANSIHSDWGSWLHELHRRLWNFFSACISDIPFRIVMHTGLPYDEAIKKIERDNLLAEQNNTSDSEETNDSDGFIN